MREEEDSQAHIYYMVHSVKVLNLHRSLTLKGFEKVLGSATHSLYVCVCVCAAFVYSYIKTRYIDSFDMFIQKVCSFEGLNTASLELFRETEICWAYIVFALADVSSSPPVQKGFSHCIFLSECCIQTKHKEDIHFVRHVQVLSQNY